MTIQSANYTVYGFAQPALIFLPSGISQTSGSITSWKDTTSVATYSPGPSVPTYDSTNNCVNFYQGQLLSSTYNPSFTTTCSVACKFMVANTSLAQYLMWFTQNFGMFVMSGYLWVINQNNSGVESSNAITTNTWYTVVISYTSGTIYYSVNNVANTTSNTGSNAISTIPQIGYNSSSGDNFKVKELMFWPNHSLSTTEMSNVYSYLSGTGM